MVRSLLGHAISTATTSIFTRKNKLLRTKSVEIQNQNLKIYVFKVTVLSKFEGEKLSTLNTFKDTSNDMY